MISRRHLLATAALAATAPRPSSAQRLAPMPLPVKLDDTVAPGYRRDVLIRWGDRVTSDAPAWNPLNPSAAAAATQFGWDARIAALVEPPLSTGVVPRAVLAVAHPTVDPVLAFPGLRDRPVVAAAMQGASLLNLEKRGGRWIVVDGGYQNRRLTADTLCRVGGPAAAPLDGSVRGLLGVTGGCATNWGTLLLTEDDPSHWISRLRGVVPRFADGFGYGWVAELNPLDPQSLPVKRTALGRFAHGDAASALTRDGRAVVYMTERRPGGLLFRFVSRGAATEPDALDQGTLYAARFDREAIRWLPLPPDAPVATAPVSAARGLGATPLDGPSGLTLDPRSGRLYLACQGFAIGGRGLGVVLEIIPAAGDHGAETGTVQILLQGQEAVPMPAPQRRDAMPPAPAPAWPAAPEALHADGRGRLWVSTNREGRPSPVADGLFGCSLGGADRGFAAPVYGAPVGAALGGAAMTPDGEVLIAAVRHPGAVPGASWEVPGTGWPSFEPGVPPRTTLIALSRAGGGPIGG